MKLIDKDALVAEIDKVMAEEMKFYETACKEGDEEVSSSPMVYTRLQILRSYIDTLEVKEVDLEEKSLTWEDIPTILTISEQLKTSWWFVDRTKDIGTQAFWEEVLKRFKAQKGEKV